MKTREKTRKKDPNFLKSLLLLSQFLLPLDLHLHRHLHQPDASVCSLSELPGLQMHLAPAVRELKRLRQSPSEKKPSSPLSRSLHPTSEL